MSAAAPLLVGVDVGTTRVKAGVVDLDGAELTHAALPTAWTRCATGAEARPADFLSATRRVLAEALAAAPDGPIAGVGIAGMAETAILIDDAGAPLGPAVAWYDQRARADFDALLHALPSGEYGRRTGLGARQIPTVATVRWLQRADPALRRARHILAVSEWVVFGLGGMLGAEPSLASRTGVLDVGPRRWWADALDWAELPADMFPVIRDAGSHWGRVVDPTPGLERLAGAVITVAGHDHLVAAVGCGATTPDQAMDSCGTAEAIVRAVPADPARDVSAGLDRGISTGWHVIPGTYNLLAGLRLGIDLTPVLRELGVEAHGGRSPLDAAAVKLLTGGDGSPAARRWLDAVRATADASMDALRHVEDLGGPVREVRISGGWAANPVLAALKAAALDQPPVYPNVTEAGVRGAALLAGKAAGLLGSAVDFPPPPLLPDSVPTPAKEMPLS